MSKFFSDNELKCKCGKCTMPPFDLDLLEILDNIRGFVGQPLYVVSGYRCPAHNTAVGGKPESAHMKAKAVDLKAETSQLRFEIVSFALMLGVKRVGIGKTFIHLDNDDTLPQEVLWLY